MRLKLKVSIDTYLLYTLSRLLNIIGWRRKERILRLILDTKLRGLKEFTHRYFMDYLFMIILIAGLYGIITLFLLIILIVMRKNPEEMLIKFKGAFIQHKVMGVEISYLRKTA